ncbi:phage baseplate assembly protein gpV [Amycolatopsis bartoniae]|uniref:Uncharacterized protein n=1 Tax=Amycolatopsis bartoniae TaxID=941986 RepID=A0A8H9J2P3_9PSEU|nr:hypothetical protein [Amycolatopsis bartoniae]MBB2938971.1 phage baseplate assembly protein gpV [Amycolatopsis bartoniae]TVT11228.1 hypothetical protein FNH07_02130 [Amycolatopsis bartoniae]GHF65855.1 hypothetical protein GCM10017566_44360 [Amycolatopsis bartoniae]
MRPSRIAAGCAAAVALAAVPGVAAAAAPAPVAYAVTTAYSVPGLSGTDYDTAAHLYRSPAGPGTAGVRPGTPESVEDTSRPRR